VHSWGFDLYPRILILDADSMVLTDLHKIFIESPAGSTIAGAPDQFHDCHDRARLNGGMIMLKPSRYFHIISAELLHDPRQSCISMENDWSQTEQELLNCMCGYRYTQYLPMRPEFRCDIMPVYNSVWPKSYPCSDVNTLPMRSIHFADATKPWGVKEDKLDDRVDTKFYKCVRDGARNGSIEELKACKGVDTEESRLLPNLRV
jgi:lipopolysaccharide biosynthesis glycosyltransferase